MPEFLGDDRVDEVVVRLGKVEALLDALTEPQAGDAAVGDREDRLDGLPAGALRVLPRVEERRACAAADSPSSAAAPRAPACASSPADTT